ncbi:hypothetical protein D9M69_705340 [compost metagenome]
MEPLRYSAVSFFTMVVSRVLSTVRVSVPWMWVVRLPSTVSVSLPSTWMSKSFSTSISKSFSAWMRTSSQPGASSRMNSFALAGEPSWLRLTKPLTVTCAGRSSGGIWSAL